MPYQLPQELKTNKFNSLPDDLRAIAEEALANKFGIPEVVKDKPKDPPNNMQYGFTHDEGFGRGFHVVTVIVDSFIDKCIPPPFGLSADYAVTKDTMIEQSVQRVPMQYNMSVAVSKFMPIDEKMFIIEKAIHRLIDDVRDKERGYPRGGQPRRIRLQCDRYDYDISSRRDIENFIIRERI